MLGYLPRNGPPNIYDVEAQSAAWPEWVNALLRSWIRCFTMIISTWWLLTSSKLCGQEFKEIHTNIESLETPKQVRIPPST